MNEARIVKLISNRFTLQTVDGQTFVASGSGLFKRDHRALVGDRVHYEQRNDHVMMVDVLPRLNQLKRPSIANVDQALLIMSALKPDFSTQLVDRMMWLILHANIQPILVVTKLDLVDSSHPVHAAIAQYEREGLRVVRVARDQKIEGIDTLLRNKISVLTGQSGVGKSSLINRLDPDIVLKTQEISKALGRGKHTTRHVELHYVQGGWLADTPGFSSLDFSVMSPAELEALVPVFAPFREACQFRDCQHVNEPVCGVKQAVEQGAINRERYTHYLEVRSLIERERKLYP
jgi:ribosome biogenesis GTPase